MTSIPAAAAAFLGAFLAGIITTMVRRKVNYPRECPQPIKEEYLLSGYLEKTNEAYALAKIAGLKMCAFYNQQYGTDYISVMPCNLYGINDNFSPENSHVLPALMRKFHEAKIKNEPTVTVWGSGKPLREFLNVDDLADACLYLMENYTGNEFFNVGYGEEISILQLAEIMKKVTGFEGNIVMDSSKPDGTPRKLTDISKIKAMGWEPKISLEEGLKQTYEWYKANKATIN